MRVFFRADYYCLLMRDNICCNIEQCFKEERPMTDEFNTNSIPQEKRQRRSDKTVETSVRWTSFRLFPIWFRLVFVLLLLVIAACAGLMIGFGVIGDGEPMDALKWGTWQHILDIINGKE